MGNIIFILSVLLSSLTFVGFGVFALKKHTPIHFWAGTVVKAEEISDVKAYNKANGIMWISYGIIICLSGLLSTIWKKDEFVLAWVVFIFIGLIAMMIIYGKIKEKYKVR